MSSIKLSITLISSLMITAVACMEEPPVQQASNNKAAVPSGSTLVDPLQMLTQAEEVGNEFLQIKQTTMDTITETETMLGAYVQLVAEFEKKYPIFLMSECKQEGKEPCLLNRRDNPEYRATYEDAVITVISNTIGSQQEKPITYVSLGSGGLFQDFIILVKLLLKHRAAHIAFHLIDPKFTPYVVLRDFLNNGREVKVNQKTDFQGASAELTDRAINEWSFPKETAEREVQLECRMLEALLKQFIAIPCAAFPNAKLSVYAHDTRDSYLHYALNTKLPPADIVTAADIQDASCNINNAVDEYAWLCYQTLKVNPHAATLLLRKNRKDTADIVRFYKTQQNGAKACPLDYGRSIYASRQEIKKKDVSINRE